LLSGASGWGAFVLVAAAYLVYLPLSGYNGFYYDAAAYWSLVDAFGRPGHFDLLAYHDAIRGYGFPLILRAIRSVFGHVGIGPVPAVRISQGILFALLGTQLLPRLVRRIFPEARITPLRILAFNALIFLFWRNYANFPLTDFAALTLMACAILVASGRRWTFVPVAGFLAGLSANLRPAYVLAAFSLGVLAAWRMRRRLAMPPPWRTRNRLAMPAPLAVVAAGVLFLAGGALVLGPQAAINRHAFHQTTLFPVGSKELGQFQLMVGLQDQKYETLVPPGGGVHFLDPATARLMSPEDPPPTYRHYLKLVAAHPIAAMAGYLRRGFNGLDVQYSSPYIRDLREERSGPRSWLLYTLLFLAVVACVRGPARTIGRSDKAMLLVFLLPVLTALTGAVEVRFMLPAAVLVYALVCFARRSPVADVPPRWRLALLVSYIAFVVTCFALADDTYSLMQQPANAAQVQK
jgi:hypothetical protein